MDLHHLPWPQSHTVANPTSSIFDFSCELTAGNPGLSRAFFREPGDVHVPRSGVGAQADGVKGCAVTSGGQFVLGAASGKIPVIVGQYLMSTRYGPLEPLAGRVPELCGYYSEPSLKPSVTSEPAGYKPSKSVFNLALAPIGLYLYARPPFIPQSFTSILF